MAGDSSGGNSQNIHVAESPLREMTEQNKEILAAFQVKV